MLYPILAGTILGSENPMVKVEDFFGSYSTISYYISDFGPNFWDLFLN